MVFSRIFKIFQSEAHAVVDKLEDPIKLTEQGIRDLKNDLQQAMTSLAQVKSLAIRLDRESREKRFQADDYHKKAVALLGRAQSGQIDAAQADQLAAEALSRKTELVNQAEKLAQDQAAQSKLADQLQAKVEQMRQTVGKYESELVTLKARARTADSMRKINQQLANIDTGGTIQMLERMKSRVEEQESLASAYGEIADQGKSLDQQIDKVLASPQPGASDSLLELKKQMGLTS